MGFELLAADTPAQDARYDEALIVQAAERGPVACVWEAQQGLVVPRTYRRYDGFDDACDRFTQMNWPVTIRQSGGGIVPQGPGVLNVSLAYAVDGKPLDHSDAAYALICDLIRSALAEYGIDAYSRAVEGSFCDGRFNLAVIHQEQARKVVGTAQLWRRHRMQSGEHRQIVLVHALILADADTSKLTALANHFENALNRGTPYQAERVASLRDLVTCAEPPTDFCARLKTTLKRKILAFPG